MNILQPGVNPNAFIARIEQAPNRVLMLDYDGTLAPFVVKRDEAVPYPGIRNILRQILESKRTRLVIISGRAIHDLIPLLSLDSLPEIWGSHGWERRLPNGTTIPPTLTPLVRDGLNQAQVWAERSYPIERFEVKGTSIAMHWRGLDPVAIEDIRTATERAWMPIAKAANLELKPFDGGVELSVPGRTKGTAVNMILDEIEGDVASAFLGDDLTDEDGFRAVQERGGMGFLVRQEQRSSLAQVHLSPPEELLPFLRYWI